MLELAIIGNREAIAALKDAIAPVAARHVREFHHKGAGGEAGLFGLVTEILLPALPNILGILKYAMPRDRDLKIIANGLELNVRDIKEAKDVIDVLQARGLLPAKGHDH
jgi:hypothetical protein